MNPEKPKLAEGSTDIKSSQVKHSIKPIPSAQPAHSDSDLEAKHNKRQVILGVVMILLVFAIAGWSLWLSYAFRHDQTLSDGLTSLQEGTKLFVSTNGTTPKELASLVGCDTGYNQYAYGDYSQPGVTIKKPSKYVFPGGNKCPLDNKQDYSYGVSDDFKTTSICAHFISPGHHDGTLTEVNWGNYLWPFGGGSNYGGSQPMVDDQVSVGINQGQSEAKDSKVSGGKVNRCVEVKLNESYKAAFRQRNIVIPDDKFDELVKRFNTDGEDSATKWYKTEIVKSKPDTGLAKTNLEISIKPKLPTCNQSNLLTRTATNLLINAVAYQSPGIKSTKTMLVSFRFSDDPTTPNNSQTYSGYVCSGSPLMDLSNVTASDQFQLKWDPVTGGIWSATAVSTTR